MTRILIVDDDPFVRAMLRRTLTRAGFEVLEAADGEEAIRFYGELPITAVLLDILMPGTDGLETITALRHVNPNVKIVAMSGGGRMKPEGLLAMASRLGAVRTFVKPIDNDELLTVLRAISTEA